MSEHVNFVDRFNAANEAIAEGVREGLKAYAFAIQEEAIEKITDENLVDTGALRRSVFVQAHGLDTRAEALAAAMALASGLGAKSKRPHGPFQAAAPGKPIEADYQAKVGVCVNYGIYLEMGTVHMAARPFLKPAANTVQAKAKDLIGKYVSEKLRKAGP